MEASKNRRREHPSTLLSHVVRTFVTEKESAAIDTAAFAKGVKRTVWLRKVIRAALSERVQ